MMNNQLCVTAGRGSAGLQKTVLSLPVPLKVLVPTHNLKSAHQVVSNRAGSDWGIV